MTDLIDDDIIEIKRPTTTTSSSASSITTTTRRPMYIETEVRTDTITRRRAGSNTHNRSIYEVLQNTKSPTDGLPPTTYTYAQSVSYMPVTQNGSYDVPVMARRDLHGSYRSSSNIRNGMSTLMSTPCRLITNVKSQITNGYSALRDRFTRQSTEQQQQEAGGSSLINSSFAGTRDSRSSSQSSSARYNLRRGGTPLHSTPRDTESEHRKISSKHRKDRQSQDDEQTDQQDDSERDSLLIRVVKRIFHIPINIFSFLLRKFFGIPWWLLLPLLLFLGFYAFPHLLCKPFEHYPESKIYQNCRTLQQYANNVTNQSVTYLRDHTFSRSVNYFNRAYRWIVNLKNTIFSQLDDIYYGLKRRWQRKVDNSKEVLSETVGSVKENAKEYCEAGIKKANALIEELRREKDRFLGTGPALSKEDRERYEQMIRKLIEEYAADETGEADYALEANGGKIVDTRCTEYTDEPRQNVVKFLGIPIVHMSKQPNIMIKAGRMPGQCFPFKGDQGSVVIKLAVPVRPTEFALEHLSKSISIVGHINSAPNNFTVYALKDKNDKEGRVLGRYFYDAENGPSLQRFKPQLPNVPIVEYIEVRVTSNWGNPNYTCLYRFRVHGDLQSTHQPSAPPAA